jgi:glucose uptake protein GlcU
LKNYRIIYISIIIGILLIEVIIALGKLNNEFIRGSLGDLLILVTIYYILRLAFNISPVIAVITAVSIGFITEGLQLFHLAEILHFDKHSIMYIIIGNTFSIEDLLMYISGGSLAFIFDKYVILRKTNKLSVNSK